MCSIAGNRSPLLLLISHLKVKQTRREGWDDCATSTAIDYLREQERKTTLQPRMIIRRSRKEACKSRQDRLTKEDFLD